MMQTILEFENKNRLSKSDFLLLIVCKYQKIEDLIVFLYKYIFDY